LCAECAGEAAVASLTTDQIAIPSDLISWSPLATRTQNRGFDAPMFNTR